jgi:DNA-binding HxlR family transcriptional regulator
VDDHSGELVVDCQLRAAIELLSHTWDPLVLVALRVGPQRRRALRAAIGGIRDKVLTEALQRLVDAGLVARQAYAEAPPRVDYALTALGRSFVDGPMQALGAWIGEHGEELLDAQEQALDRPRTAVRP